MSEGKFGEFSVGQKVTVASGQRIYRITEVRALTPKMMTLADGTRWKNRGLRPWGETHSWYMGPSVREYRDGDERLLERLKNIDRISSFRNWDKLSDDTLALIATAIKEPTA